jgi:hypothetical protein
MLSKAALGIQHYGTADNNVLDFFPAKASREEFGRKLVHEITNMTLPYYAPDPSLPPIPTAEDVEKAGYKENNLDYRGAELSGGVYRVNSVCAVKFSKSSRVMLVIVQSIYEKKEIAAYTKS